jgi:putative cardiolipin synthase
LSRQSTLLQSKLKLERLPMRTILKAPLILALVFLVFSAGCSRLEPIDLPWDASPTATQAGPLANLDNIYAGDWQVPLNDGPNALAWRLRAIDSATESIELQSFIWKNDTVGSLIRERLFAAADRGVQVRILIDDSFLVGQDSWVLEIAHHENIQYRIYNPYKRRSSSALSRTILNLSEFHRLDHRMHNKVMVVDGLVGIIGGRNLADEYFGLDPAANFRDMEFLVGGPIVQSLTRSFDDYWNDKWAFPIDAVTHVSLKPPADQTPNDNQEVYETEDPSERLEEWQMAVRNAYRGRTRLMVDDPPKDTPDAPSDEPVQVANALYDILRDADEEIIIVSAYLIPTPVLTDELRQAVARGVRIQMLTNSINSNNHISAYAAYRNHVAELLSAGAAVHEVRVDAESRPRYIFPPVARKNLGLHAKYLIVDQKSVFVGSTNLDPRSLRINTEIGLLVRDRALAKAMSRLTAPDFDRSNAWELQLDETGALVWIGHDQIRKSEPASTGFQRLEEWFFANLPIEQEL